MVPGTILLLLSTTAVIAASGARIESGVVLLPNETLVAPAGPVAAPRPAPKPAPRPTPQASREEIRNDAYSRSSRSVCINCGVITGIEEGDTGWEVRVQFDDGSRETLRYYERPRLRVGDAVHLEDGRLIRE
jgi:hypothetical protein